MASESRKVIATTPSLMIGCRKYRKVLSATRATTVRPVSTMAVSTSSPDVRRPVAARHAIAAYDHPSAAMIAGQTPNTSKQTRNSAAGTAHATVRLSATRRRMAGSEGRSATGAGTASAREVM